MSGIPRRIRASRIYAGLSREELGAAIERSADVIREIELGRRNVGRHEVPAIAKACEVPIWFIEHGFHGGSTRFVIISKDLHAQLEPGQDVDPADTYPAMGEGLVLHRVGPLIVHDEAHRSTSPGTGDASVEMGMEIERGRDQDLDADEGKRGRS